ncbi:TPA: hypothetical protein PC496_000802 [Clostridioides difficile]|nr:hypothetical protein [Clostridioides difficile]
MNLNEYFEFKKLERQIDKQLQEEAGMTDEELTIIYYLFKRNGESIAIKQLVEDTGLKYSIANRAINKLYINKNLGKERRIEDQRTVFVIMNDEQMENAMLIIDTLEEKLENLDQNNNNGHINGGQ